MGSLKYENVSLEVYIGIAFIYKNARYIQTRI